MDEEELRRSRSASLRYCEKLLNELRSELDDIDLFFGGDLHRAYVDVTDEVIAKASNVRKKIRNL